MLVATKLWLVFGDGDSSNKVVIESILVMGWSIGSYSNINGDRFNGKKKLI